MLLLLVLMLILIGLGNVSLIEMLITCENIDYSYFIDYWRPSIHVVMEYNYVYVLVCIMLNIVNTASMEN